MSPLAIDLNADLGEFDRPGGSSDDEPLMAQVSSANIACGGHVGNDQTMRETLLLARRYAVAPGAHPSFPDREHFGRVEMKLDGATLEGHLRRQLQTLAAIAAELGMKLHHVKAHGALYHAIDRNPDSARALGRAVLATDPALLLVVQDGSRARRSLAEMGLHTLREAFADRAYEADGSLRSRSLPGALLEDPAQAARQALEIARHGRVLTADGKEIAVSAESLCVHSDTPGAPEIARQVRCALTAGGFVVRCYRPEGESSA